MSLPGEPDQEQRRGQVTQPRARQHPDERGIVRDDCVGPLGEVQVQRLLLAAPQPLRPLEERRRPRVAQYSTFFDRGRVTPYSPAGRNDLRDRLPLTRQ